MRSRSGGMSRWSRRMLAATLCAGPAVGFFAPSQVLAQPKPAAEADAAQKKLLAASGLFNRGMFRLAATNYQDFLQQFPAHPDTTSARYALGVCHYRLNEFDKSVEALTLVLADAKFEQRDEALAVIGHSNLSLQKYDKAIASFDALLTQFPKSKHAEGAALNKAQAYYLAAKYAEAATAAQAFVRLYPKSADHSTATYFLGLSQKALDQNDAAIVTLAALLKDDPTTRYSFDATLVLGQALEAMGKLDEAAGRYRQLLAAAPAARQADAQYSLGAVLYKLGKYDDAGKAFTAVLSQSNDGPYAKPARLQLGLVQLAGGRVMEARKTLSAVAKDDLPNAPAARYGLAQCDMSEEKYEAAIAALEELIKLQPPPVNAAQLAFDRALCLAGLKRHDEAARAFEGFAASNPKSQQVPEAVYRQAFSLHQVGKYDVSHALCEKLASGAASDFTNPAAELDAENLFLLQKYEAASKAYTVLGASAKDDDRRNRFSFRLGQCAYSLGDYAKAVEVLKPLANQPKVASDEKLGRALFLLGDALLQQAKFAEAAEAFSKYLAAIKTGSGEKSDKQEAQYKLAISQLRSTTGTPPAAARTLLTTVAAGSESSPWTARANFELGQLAYQQDPPQLEQASSALKKVMAFNHGNPPEEIAAPSLYLLGWVDFNGKHFDNAAKQWAEVMQKYASSAIAPEASFYQGVALKESGKQDEAFAALSGYVKANPKGKHAIPARQMSAACLTSLKRHDEARKLLIALSEDKSAVSDSVLYDLAWANKNAKDDAGASAAYRRLMKEFPDSKLIPATRTELAESLFNAGKYLDSAELLEPIATKPAVDAKVRSVAAYLLGRCYEKLGKPDKAAEILAAYAKEFPNDERAADALLLAGVAQASGQKFDDAEKSFSEMLKRFPNHPQASVGQLKLAEAQADGGRFADSLASHQRFLQKYPKDALAHRAQFGAGWALENQKQFVAAREAYGKVTASHNGEYAARAQFQIGETYFTETKFDQAVPAFLAVEDVYAYPVWSARALYEAGRAFEELKQPDMARQQYTAVVTKYKDQANEAKLAQARLTELKRS